MVICDHVRNLKDASAIQMSRCSPEQHLTLKAWIDIIRTAELEVVVGGGIAMEPEQKKHKPLPSSSVAVVATDQKKPSPKPTRRLKQHMSEASRYILPFENDKL